MPERGRICLRNHSRSDTSGQPSLRERLADGVDISKELILDTVLMTWIGDRELTLENYKGILEYTNTCIRVKAKPSNIKILGTDLELRNITRELLFITGRIQSIEFCKQ